MMAANSYYTDLARHAIRRVADKHDPLDEELLVIEVREAIEKAVAEAVSSTPGGEGGR